MSFKASRKRKNWGWRRRDVYLLLLGGFIVLIPLWQGVFNLVPWAIDDSLFSGYPIHRFVAYWLKRGVLPLWDPHMGCGLPSAWRPALFHLPLYPFWLLADPSDLRKCYLMIECFPVAVFAIIGLINSYALGRFGFRFSRPGTLFFALTYMLSPLVLDSRPLLDALCLYAWLPLALLGILRYARKPKLSPVIWGGVGVMQLITAGLRSDSVHVFTSIGCFVLFLAFYWFICRNYRAMLRTMAGGLLVLLIGALLAAPATLASAEALLAIRQVYRPVLAGAIQFSVPPTSFLVHLLPLLFGDYTGTTWWGPPAINRQPPENFMFAGGTVFWCLVIIGILRWRGKRKGVESLAWWVAILLMFFGLFLMMGRYTPLYRILFKIFPVFKAPYPERWRLLPTLAGSIMAGATISRGTRSTSKRWINPQVTGVYLIVLLVALIVMINYPTLGTSIKIPPEKLAAKVQPKYGWLLTRTLPYFLVASIILLGWSGWRTSGRRLILFILSLSLIELTVLATARLYRPPTSAPYWPDETTLAALARNPVYQKTSDPLSGRFVYPVSTLASIGWYNYSYSFLQFSTKSLSPRLIEAVSQIASGYPYEFTVRDVDSPLLTNMGVRYVWVQDRVGWIPSRSNLVTISDAFAIPSPYPFWSFAIFWNSQLRLYKLIDAMPRLYFQDRWLVSDEKEQLFSLLHYDLRNCGYCGSEVWDRRPVSEHLVAPFPLSENEWCKHFDFSQKNNSVSFLDLSHPNRVVMEVEISQPCMMVMNDVWHPGWKASVDGEVVNLYRVNYLQRGTWLDSGRHLVKWSFHPHHWAWGVPVSFASIILLCLVGVVKRSPEASSKLDYS